jgi:hypothetical protein
MISPSDAASHIAPPDALIFNSSILFSPFQKLEAERTPARDRIADRIERARRAVEAVDLDLVGHLVPRHHELLARHQLEVARKLAAKLRDVLQGQLSARPDLVECNRVVSAVRGHQDLPVCRRLDRRGLRHEILSILRPAVKAVRQHRRFVHERERRAVEGVVRDGTAELVDDVEIPVEAVRQEDRMARSVALRRLDDKILPALHRRRVEEPHAVAAEIDDAHLAAPDALRVEEKRLVRKRLLLTLLVVAHVVVRKYKGPQIAAVDSDRAARR